MQPFFAAGNDFVLVNGGLLPKIRMQARAYHPCRIFQGWTIFVLVHRGLLHSIRMQAHTAPAAGVS
jgi:hypothetical protein